MLVRRKYPPKQDYWDLPGGFVDLGESMEESMKREIKEEIGIDIKDLKYFSSYSDRYLFKDIYYWTICFVYIGEIHNSNLKPTDDVSEIKFFSPSEIPISRLAFNCIKQSLKDYIKKLSNYI